MLQFICKKCKHSFSIERHPLFHSFKEKINEIKGEESPELSDQRAIELFVNIAVDITKSIRCPQCQATVKLTSIGSWILDRPLDASTSEPFVQNILDFVDLSKEYEKTPTSDPLKYSDERSDFAKGIAEHLMWHPGTLVYLEDPELIADAKKAIDDLWDNTSYAELCDEMFSGGFSSLMVSIVGNYIENVKSLKPTFVSIEPGKEIRTYFQQAMTAWCHGLNTAALILSCSILEKTLHEALLKKDAKLIYKSTTVKSFKALRYGEYNFEEKIDNAKDVSMFDEQEKNKAHKIRIARNNAVHNIKQSSKDETYRMIMTTKDLLEKLLH